MPPSPLPPIRFGELAAALLADAESLVPKWMRDGVRDGHEWKCGDVYGNPGRSCSVNLHTGEWADFQSGEAGKDLLSLYKARFDLATMAAAALQVARDEGLESVAGIVRGTGSQSAPRAPAPPPQPAARKRDEEGWVAVRPVPANAMAPTFRHHARSRDDIVHTAEYRIGDELHGFVVRFRTSDGGKDTLPYTWCTSAKDGASRWHWKTWEEPRPLYFPGHQLPAGRTVILVEGEKKADGLQRQLDGGAPGIYCVASWASGCKAWSKADWILLAGCTVVLWPDCDGKREPLTPTDRKEHPDKADQVKLQQGKPLLPAEKQPGMAAMLGIGALLRDTHGCQVQLLPIPQPLEVPDGWDCGDAIEHDGWDFARTSAFLGTAFALPAGAQVAPPAPAAAPAAAKKVEAPADAGKVDTRGRPIPWWLEPYWDADKGRWLVSRKLVIAALTHDVDLEGVLGLNLLSNSIEARRPWPWDSKPRPLKGSDDLLLGKYLTDTYGLPSIARAALTEAIETVAHTAPFHPVRTYLESLRWDGTPRLDKWLVFALGETPETLEKPSLYEYLSLVGRYWLLGMVNRVMDPGCKFDYCPVLEGKGGLGKSTLVEALATTAYYSDTHFDVSRGKEGQEQVQGLWVYEIAELQQFGKAEIQLIKAFISAKVDRYRPSYGRVVESYPRQCLLVGTTNERTYLRDRTGNRRFWPVPVRNVVNNPWVRKWRDQLLAEAFALYEQGAQFYPGRDEEERLFVPMQESRLVETAVHSELLHVLTRDPVGHGIGAVVNGLTDFVTISQLTQALGIDAAKSSSALEGQIRAWLEHEGWEHRKKKLPTGSRPWGYARPPRWPQVEVDEDDQGSSSSGSGTPPQRGADPSGSSSQEACDGVAF